MPDPVKTKRLGILALIGPGLLVAATGVGAGDLATAGVTGARLGLAIAWAVLLGAFLKFVLTEGLARYQIATGKTLIRGMATDLGPIARWIFLLYLAPWTIFTGRALMSACGATADALLPNILPNATSSTNPALINDALILGFAQSLIAVALVYIGGFKLFERIMTVAIAGMTITVVAGAILLKPDIIELAKGLTTPRIPEGERALASTVALIGGVGGTLTILCYGYWIREHKRDNAETKQQRQTAIRGARIDLILGYTLTALFGIAMIVISSRVEAPKGSGAKFIIALADQLGDAIHPAARWAFLCGAWAAVFSSLLGVWQSVPYLFADFIHAKSDLPEGQNIEKTRSYKAYLWIIAIAPVVAAKIDFGTIQTIYGVIGATIVPMLAIVLLILGARTKTDGKRLNGLWTNLALIAALVVTTWFALGKL